MEIIRITVLRVAASRKICLKSICRGTYCNFRLASSAPSRTSQKIRNSKRENAWTRQDVDYSAHASRKIENLFNRRDRATLKCAERRSGFFSFPFRFNIWDISFRRRTRFQPDPFRMNSVEARFRRMNENYTNSIISEIRTTLEYLITAIKIF